MKRFGPKLRKNRCIFICKTDVHLILIDLSNIRRVHCLILSNTGLFKIDFLLEVKTRDRGLGVLPVQVAPLCAGPSPGLSGRQRFPPLKIQVRQPCSLPKSCWGLFISILHTSYWSTNFFCFRGLCTYGNHRGHILWVDRHESRTHSFLHSFFWGVGWWFRGV